MAGYQTIEALRPILHRGPPAAPVVDRSLIFGGPRVKAENKREEAPWFVTTKMIARMRKLRADGNSLTKIGRELRVSQRTVARYTQDVKPPKGGWPKNTSAPQFDLEEAKRLRLAGWSCPKIAKKLGCARSTVYYLLYGRKNRSRDNRSVVQPYIGAVSRASGLQCKELRCAASGGGKKGSKELSKARAILYWVVSRSTGENKTAVGRMLGGFTGTTVMDGIIRVDRVVQALDLNVPQFPAHLIKALWRADWENLPCAQ